MHVRRWLAALLFVAITATPAAAKTDKTPKTAKAFFERALRRAPRERTCTRDP